MSSRWLHGAHSLRSSEKQYSQEVGVNTNSKKTLDGRWLASVVHRSVRAEVTKYYSQAGRPPGLGVIIVGDNPASRAYVKTKAKVAERECGFLTFDRELPGDVSADHLARAIESFNLHDGVDGILLQLPLPQGLNSNHFIELINPAKDVDGLHPYNQGLLQRGEGHLRPCTPIGVLAIIDLAFSDITPGDEGISSIDQIPKQDLAGKTAVVVGRSILVGKPLVQLLLERNATVITVHSKTKEIERLTREGDIVVAAVGVPGLVKADWIKEGATVIDVGINRVADGTLVGDVDHDSVLPKCGAITPVPGGVGPMTVAMLMANTLEAYKQKLGV